MVTIKTDRLIDANRLHDYLIANLAGFHKTFVNATGTVEGYRDSGRVSQIGPTITIEAPGEVSRADLAAAIALYGKILI